jgi:ABC-2 type transport system ATP-binding protein
MLDIKNLQKYYGNYLVLDIQNFIIPDGINVIVGKNGCGKSTFLKVLAGLSPFSGNIIFNKTIKLGVDTYKQRKLISICEAEPDFPKYISGDSLIKLFKNLKNHHNDYIKLLQENFEMNNYMKTNIGNYSSGMKKKLGLLLSFIGDNKLILLDEPFTLLDATSRKLLLETIQTYSKQSINFIISSHQNQDNLFSFATNIFEIENKTIYNSSINGFQLK